MFGESALTTAKRLGDQLTFGKYVMATAKLVGGL